MQHAVVGRCRCGHADRIAVVAGDGIGTEVVAQALKVLREDVSIDPIYRERFRREGRTGRAVGSIVTGVAFLASFVGIASGSASPAITLTFTGAVLLVWTAPNRWGAGIALGLLGARAATRITEEALAQALREQWEKDQNPARSSVVE